MFVCVRGRANTHTHTHNIFAHAHTHTHTHNIFPPSTVHKREGGYHVIHVYILDERAHSLSLSLSLSHVHSYLNGYAHGDAAPVSSGDDMDRTPRY